MFKKWMPWPHPNDADVADSGVFTWKSRSNVENLVRPSGLKGNLYEEQHFTSSSQENMQWNETQGSEYSEKQAAQSPSINFIPSAAANGSIVTNI